VLALYSYFLVESVLLVVLFVVSGMATGMVVPSLIRLIRACRKIRALEDVVEIWKRMLPKEDFRSDVFWDEKGILPR